MKLLILTKVMPFMQMLLSPFENGNPLDIISDGMKNKTYAYQLNRATGIAQIEAIVELAGYFSGVILIITTLFLLYFLNYQRYISDAKQRIAYILMTVATISAYTFIGDVILTIIMDAFL